MARASYVYIVGPDLDGGLYAFTVKHEAQTFTRRHRNGDWAKTGRVVRLPDGHARSPQKTYSVEEFLDA